MTLLHKLFGASGRLRRRDYWILSISANVLIALADVLASYFLGTSPDGVTPGNAVSWLLYIPSIWIGIALMLKRAHDREKGGGWVVLFIMLPIIGWIWGIIELGFLDGTQGPNRYGPSPKGVGGDVAATVLA
jgi:uncharacterized membrane protein YhaH (DUF805 family)